MKVFAFILAVCIVGAFADSDSESMRKYKDDCITETGVERANVDKIKDNVFLMDDLKLRCFAKCMMMKTDVMTDDGTFKMDTLKEKMVHDVAADKIDDVLQKCTTIPSGDPCEKALNTLKCFVDTSLFTVSTD